MSQMTLRPQVLKAYKSLQKTRKIVFDGDSFALEKARLKINEEYKKCKDVRDPKAVEELIAYSNAVENELKMTVIQAKEVAPGKYEVNFREDLPRIDNVPFKECKNK